MRSTESSRNRQWNNTPIATANNITAPANTIHRPPSAPVRRKEFPTTKKSPEAKETEDGKLTYVAAGTAPVKSTPTPPKSVSPVTSITQTSYAGYYPAQYAQPFSNTIDPAPSNPNFNGTQLTDSRTPNRPRDKLNSGKYETTNNYRKPASRGQSEENQTRSFRISNQQGEAWNRRSEFSYNTDRRGNNSVRRWENVRPEISSVYPQLSNASMLGSNIHRLPYVESKDRQRRQRNGENTNDMARLLQMMERQHVQSASPPPPLEAAENVWPAPGNPTDSKTEVVPPPLVTSPPKQNYSEVVARSTPRSSVSDVPKEQTPILYSQKAASSLHAHEGKVHHEPKKEPCLVQKPEQLISAKSECTVRGERRVCPETATVQISSNIAGRGVCTTAENKVSEKSPPSPSAAPSPPPSEPVNEAGNFEISKMDVLSEQIWHFHNKITQKESTLTRKLSLRDMLYFAICPVFPMCGLYVVGSSLNGFGNDKSDMDLCLMITNKEIDQKSDAVLILNMILSTLQKMDWVVHQKLILAKVPILRIKFAAPYQDITVDLNANNSVAIRNTHLLCYYSSFDWRVRPLVSTVKEWAKRKGINDANRSSFTSYSLVLMVIHYLQCGTDPHILPSLQNKYKHRFNGRLDVRTLNVTQALPNMEPPWKYHDKSSLGELLIGFLKYFATKFDYNAHAISVREGKLISRSAVMRPQPGYSNNVTWRSQWRCICIEEPFTFNNTAHSIYDEMVFDAIKRAFEEAFEDLDKTRDISCLLECIPITVIPPIHGATAFVCDGINKETILEAAMIHGEPTPSDLLLSNSGSSISLHTAELGSGSACNSMYGEDNEKENYQRPSSTESMSMRSHGGQRNPTTNGRSYNNSRHRGARQGPRGGANPIRYQQRGSS